MSLVPTYIRATDGFFYKNPTLKGHGWFICFDDDDPAELVISLKNKDRAEKILQSIGIKFSNLRYQGTSGRLFGKGFKFTDAKSFFFDLENRIDPKFISEFDDKVKNIQGDCVFYDPKI